MFTSITDFISLAVVILVPWIFLKLIKSCEKDCCPECVTSGMMRGKDNF